MALFSFYDFSCGDKMTKHYIDLKAFPNLKFEELQNRAKDWVDGFDAIKFGQILLYHHDKRPSKYIYTASRFFRDWRSIKYVLVFVVSNYPDKDLSKFKDFPMGVEIKGGDLITKKINGSDDNNGLWDWIYSLRQIENPAQFVNSPADIDKHPLFDSDFCNEVYNSPPDENFYKKWRTILKRPHEKLDSDLVRDDKPFWVIYPKSSVKVEKDELKYKEFNCPPGTSWEQIKIALVENDIAIIKTPTINRRVSYHELGMSDIRRGNKPKKIWIILILFAQFNCRLDGEIPESIKRILLNDYKIDYYKKLPDYTKRLNKHLKDLFGINDSIFKFHYKKHKAYITKIEFSDRREIPKFDNIDFAEKSLHTVEVEDIQDKLSIPDIKRSDA
jgi:hypothetical protein